MVTGDIALQKDYDPCAYNSDVIVALPRTNGSIETHVMKKRDIGSMPNAIVDIWKNGVSYWGYTYNSSLSIGNATIQHN